MTNAVLTRVVRRETHSPRTVVTVVMLVLVAAAAIYAGVEIVLHLLGVKPLLVAPGDALAWLIDMPSDGAAAGVGTGAAVAAVILGVVVIWLAVTPGRRSKHELGDGSHAVVVDNGVIASAVAERIRRELDLSKDGATVGIGHRSADVTVRPEPGQEIESGLVREIAQSELASYGLVPAVRVRARVQRTSEPGGVK